MIDKRDAFIWSVYAGALSAILAGIVQLVLIRMGLQVTSVWEVAAGIFLPVGQISTPIGSVIGFAGHLIIGAIWGVAFYVLLLLFGVNESFYKGVLLGLFIWFFGTEMMRWGATNYVVYGSQAQLGKLTHDLIFGASLGYFVPSWAMHGASENKAIVEGLLASTLAQPASKAVQKSEQDNIEADDKKS